LLEASGNADIGWSRVPLQTLHGDAVEQHLQKLGAEVVMRARVQRIESGAGDRAVVCDDGTRFSGDAVILATTHEEAAELLPGAAGIDAADLRKLGRSPIVNLHVVFDRKVTDYELAAGTGTRLEWIFDRSGGSGLESGQYLAITLSAADAYVGRSVRELQALFVPEIERLFPRARGAQLLRFYVTCERAATFHQVPGTARLRPGARTATRGLYVAGAWTDTGWPATMEGAVRSGQTAARYALRDTARGRGLSAAAA
jgi:phytoene dehydrogenase-like protein